MTKSAPPYAEQRSRRTHSSTERHAGSGRFDDVSELAPDNRNKTGIGFSASDAPTARQVEIRE